MLIVETGPVDEVVCSEVGHAVNQHHTVLIILLKLAW